MVGLNVELHLVPAGEGPVRCSATAVRLGPVAYRVCCEAVGAGRPVGTTVLPEPVDAWRAGAKKRRSGPGSTGPDRQQRIGEDGSAMTVRSAAAVGAGTGRDPAESGNQQAAAGFSSIFTTVSTGSGSG